MASPYSGPETASAIHEAQLLHDKHRRWRVYPPIEQDDRDAEARRLLAAYYRRLWAHARDLQDPTWWQRHAPHDESES